MDSLTILKATTTGMIGLFTGGALYISAIEHPGRLRNVRPGIRLFKDTIIPASKYQGGLAALAAITSAVTAQISGDSIWYVGTSMGLALWGWTVALILPLNHQLLRLEDNDEKVKEGEGLLKKWGKLHAVRTGISVASFLFLTYRLAK
ncbi:hypothetical protein HDU97_003293 [Phlyctochytrium planicorne]|nr:hypothetical protein HDU97_003293 [Phlyctochytrium planicorne]